LVSTTRTVAIPPCEKSKVVQIVEMFGGGQVGA